MLRRLMLGLGANMFAQVVTILIQVLSLPVFLSVWDTATYGTWLLISAIPAYFTMADVGIASVAGTKMTMSMGRGDRVTANVVFQSTQLFVSVMCVAAAAAVALVLLVWPMRLDITTDMKLALAGLVLAVLISLYGGVWEAVFRATNRYAFGTLLGQISRLAEWLGGIAGLVLFTSFAGVAAGGLVGRAISTVLIFILGRRGDHGLEFGISKASREELRLLARPSMSFMVFPLANALSFQGITLVVGALSGSAAVTIFSAYRTIARVAVQLTSILSHALWPEFARLAGQAGIGAVQPIYRRFAILGGLGAVAFSVALYFISPWLLAIWTQGRIAFVPDLMLLLLAYAAVAGLWHIPRSMLMATNNHIGLSAWCLGAAILSVVLAWTMGLIWDVQGVGAAMLLSEMFIAATCIYLTQRSFTTWNGQP